MQEKISYRKNKLRKVIVRVDYEKITIPPELLAGIQSEFPQLEEIDTAVSQLTFTSDAQTKFTSERLKTKKFSSIDKNKSMAISDTFSILEYRVYNGFEKLKKDFSCVEELMKKCSLLEKINRIGLRYVNVFDNFNKGKLNAYINKKYLNGILINANQSENLSRHLHVLEFNDDTYKTKVQYGFFNPAYPYPCGNYDFTLDTDVYIDCTFEKEYLAKYLDDLHSKCSSLFEDFITEKTRKLLEK